VAERVLLVTVDTLRADHVGSYGATDAHTPTLDTLAASGVRFDDAVSPVPLTLPAHASLMTALEPPGHGIRHNGIHRLAAGIPTLAEAMRAKGFATGAVVGALVLAPRYGLDRGFDHYDAHMTRQSSEGVGYAERPADAVVDAALAWLERAPARFFLWVHFYDPHARYAPPPGFAAGFANRPYQGEIAFVDHELGRLLRGIRTRFGDEGLLVLATSDHGEALGEHGEPGHSYSLYEATQRIPLLLAGAGIPAGVVVEGPVRLVDVAPTLLARVGAPALPESAGRDLMPLLQVGHSRQPAYVETLATHYDYGWSPLVGLRTERFKYIRAPTPELYDLEADPQELTNLAASAPDEVARLDAQVEAWLEKPGRSAVPVSLDAEERRRLESLGYVVPEPVVGAHPERATGPDPKDEIGVLALASQAEAQLARGRFDEALALLADLVDPPPHLAALRAAIAINAKAWPQALRDARRLVALAPGRVDGRILLGQAHEGRGDADAAAVAYESALAIDPGSIEGWRALIRIRRMQGDDAGAQEAQRQVEALEARFPSSSGESAPFSDGEKSRNDV
jgi:arylsulfatase A-like enzyme